MAPRGSRIAAGLLAGSMALAGCVRPLRPVPARPDGVAAACVPAGGWVAPATRRALLPRTVIARSLRRRIVLLGERHDAADHHRWQLSTLAALHALRPDVVVGFEAFPRRVQPVLDRWTAGTLDEETFLAETAWEEVWGYDPALYLPLFHFARLGRLPMVGLNVDRTLVARVGAQGLASIPERDREGIGVPAPARPEYLRLLADAYASHEPAGRRPSDEAGLRRFVEAQLLWDRAMAEALAAAVRERPSALVVGMIGSGHLERRFGVPHQLAALGLHEVTVLLPWDTDRHCGELAADLADAVFGIDSRRTADPPPPPRLGVTLAADTDRLRVTRVEADSLAARAGMRAGDVVLEAAGLPLRTPGDLRRLVRRQAPGTWLPLRVRRGAVERTLVAKFPPERIR